MLLCHRNAVRHIGRFRTWIRTFERRDGRTRPYGHRVGMFTDRGVARCCAAYVSALLPPVVSRAARCSPGCSVESVDGPPGRASRLLPRTIARTPPSYADQ